MSRTDKHRPVWVQIKDPDNKGWLREDHDHRKGDCDLGDPQDPRFHDYAWHTWRNLRQWPNCSYGRTTLAYYNSGMWPKMPRKGGWGRPNPRDGKARMRLRALEAEVLKVHRAQVPCWCGGCDLWEDALPDWNEHKPTNAWLWWKSD